MIALSDAITPWSSFWGRTSSAAIDFHFNSSEWVPGNAQVISGATVGLAALFCGLGLVFLFRRKLQSIQRALLIGNVFLAAYLALVIIYPQRVMDPADRLTWWLHRLFVGAFLLVALRLVDWLAIAPVLTRGGKLPMPRFVHQIVLAVLYIFAMLAYLSESFGIDVSNVVAGSAVISIVLGLALQETLGNFFSGLVVQTSSPFLIGDWVKCGDVEGRVIDMTWRAVTLQDLSDNVVHIPNSAISKAQIINFEKPTPATWRSIVVGVDYNVPPNDVKRVLLQAANESVGVMKGKNPLVFVGDFGESAVTYKVIFAIDQPHLHGLIESRVRTNVWYRLKQAGMTIPYPIRVIETVNAQEREKTRLEADIKRRANALCRVELLAPLGDEYLQKLASDAHEIQLAAGQVLYHQADSGQSFFVLTAGTAEAVAVTACGDEVVIAQAQTGEYFGEVSALTGQPRSTTVRALTDLTCIEIDHKLLLEVFAANPNVMEKMSALMAKRQKLLDEKLKSCESRHLPEEDHHQQHSILEHMRNLFTKLLRAA